MFHREDQSLGKGYSNRPSWWAMVFSRAIADQLMTIVKERVRKRIGRVLEKELEAVDQALRIQLALS